MTTVKNAKPAKPSKSVKVADGKLDAKSVKAGDLMLFCYYGKVARPTYYQGTGGMSLEVQGVAGAPANFQVNGTPLIESGYSADYYGSEQQVTKTRAAEILTAAWNRPFTVCFLKLDNTERVLRGILVEPEPLLGRSHVLDLDVQDGDGLRLVDHRTVRYIILEGVKYSVK